MPTPSRRVARRLLTNSWEVLVALFLLAGSLPRLFGAPAPQSVEAVFPLWLRFAWGAFLLAGGIGVVAGVAAGRDRLERASLFLLAGSGIAYAAALLGFNGWVKGAVAAAYVSATAAGCVVELARPRLLARLSR